MYSAPINPNTLVDCSAMCCGIATENMLEKYPSADTLLNNRTRCYFLSCFRHRLEQRRFCLDMILGDPLHRVESRERWRILRKKTY